MTDRTLNRPTATETDPTALDLAAIRSTIPASYPGPWYVHLDDDGQWLVGYLTSNPLGGLVAAVPDYGQQFAAFIAAARTNIPALLAEVDRLREQAFAQKPVIDAVEAWAELVETGSSAPAHASALIDLHEAVEQYRLMDHALTNAAPALCDELEQLRAEVARTRAVAQTYRNAMVGQHEWGGHLIDGDCTPCAKAAADLDGSLACQRYQQWQREYEAAASTTLPEASALAADTELEQIRAVVAAARAWRSSHLTDPTTTLPLTIALTDAIDDLDAHTEPTGETR